MRSDGGHTILFTHSSFIKMFTQNTGSFFFFRQTLPPVDGSGKLKSKLKNTLTLSRKSFGADEDDSHIKLTTSMRGSRYDVQLLDRWAGSSRNDFRRSEQNLRNLFTFFARRGIYCQDIFTFQRMCAYLDMYLL